MDRGTYTATSGGIFQFNKLDIVNNNLANINTPGFKRQILVGDTQTFDQTLASLVAKDDPYAQGDHARSPGVVNVKTATDYSLGPIKNTGNHLDAALRNPKDFFVINTPTGPQYTRAGNFTLDVDGNLVTADGQQVAGDGGAITATGAGVRVAADGSLISDNLAVGKLQVVRIENPDNLERVAAARFKLKPGTPAPEAVEADLVTQALEMSNVSAITSVIDLITTNKAFDMYTKSVKAIDEMNNTAISQIGRSR